MTIRRFQKSDAEQIAMLFHNTVRSVNSTDYSEKQVRAWAPDDIHFRNWAELCSQKFTFVADDNGIIAGFAELEEEGYIDCFFCHKDYQRKGVGSQLYNHIEELACSLKIARLYTEASITAKPFFLNKGFSITREQVVETRGVKFKNFVMEKILYLE